MNTNVTQIPEAVQAKWLKEGEVSEITGISLSTLRKHRFRQVGIRFSKIGRSVRYSLADVLSFMDARRVEPRCIK